MIDSFWVPTRLHFGIHTIENLAEFRGDFSGRHALLITSRFHAKQGEVVEGIIKQLTTMGIVTEMFAGVHAEPTSALVDSVSEIRRLSKCDLIIALGGGSVVDVAKFVAMMATNGGRCADYETGRAVAKSPLPLVAMPTTAGSGSELTPYGVIINSQTRRKFTVSSTHFYPRSAVVDPALSVSQPAMITLASGLDAWIQALEAYLSAQSNALITPLIESVLKAVPSSLSALLMNPSDLIGRAELSRSAAMGGIIISHLRTGLVHTMSVALSAHVDLPHGLLNAVILPWVLEFNFESCDRERLDFLYSTTFLPLSCPHAFSGHPRELQQVDSRLKQAGVTAGFSREGTLAFDRIGDWLKKLGVPETLSKFKLDERIIPSLVNRVKQDSGLPAVNPRSFSADDLAGLFRKVLFDA